MSLILKSDDSKIRIDGLTTPIKLAEYKIIDPFYEKVTSIGNGPSLKWLLEHATEINDPDPDKVFYIDNMAIYFKFFKNKDTVISFLNIKNMECVLKEIDDSIITWLNYETFDNFLKSYGYTNKITNKDIALILITYQFIKKLESKNPEKVIKHFYDKQLIAELTLKGVFDKL